MPSGVSREGTAPRVGPRRKVTNAEAHSRGFLGVSDVLGTIEVGKLADLVFLGGDPLQDIRRTRDVRRVMRGGRLYDPGMLGVLQEPPR
jgi:cytosine/adenosine deaminase-related metal-dependent hydrolase